MKVNEDRIRAKMETLAHHWSIGPRAIGHTHAMRVGSDKAECFVMAHNVRYARELTGGDPRRALTIDDLPEKLVGLRKPLLIDHYAMGMLCSQAAQAIYQLQQEVKKLRADKPSGDKRG